MTLPKTAPLGHIFHLFARGILRFSELEKAIPGVSQKMLIQQLRELERDGIVTRTVHPQVPPKVEYALTKWGKAMCPALLGLRRFMASAAERQRLSRRRKFAILGLVQTDLRSSERLSFAPRSAASSRESYAPALAAVTDSGMVERKTLSGS
jgi:DNA-binding HxlR family transcriptional regulator